MQYLWVDYWVDGMFMWVGGMLVGVATVSKIGQVRAITREMILINHEPTMTRHSQAPCDLLA